MRPSKYIPHIARINLLKKKQRTWLSIIAVSLSTTIFFTSITLFKDIYDFSKGDQFNSIGDFHYACYLDQEYQPSSRYHETRDVSAGLQASYQNQPLALRTIDSAEENPVLPFALSSGRLAQTEEELVVAEDLGLAVGDSVELELGTLEAGHGAELYHLDPYQDQPVIAKQSFTICGLYTNNEEFKKYTAGWSLAYGCFEPGDDAVLYIRDDLVHLSDSFDYFVKHMNIPAAAAYTNSEAVSRDSVYSYLQDTTVLLILFVIIAVIGIAMSLISVRNVVLISDKDRKKELGLLKSIGATPNEIKRLLQIELYTLGIIGALLGVVLGIASSYVILNLFIDRLYITLTWKMYANPWIIALSLICGVALMVVSGMKAYAGYITSNAIADLKNFSYEYGTPEKTTTTRRRSFSWRMFIIYNGRMKKQTRNIFHSFFLYLATMVLFTSIFLSNVIYKNQYVDQDYDFDITNYQSVGLDAGLRETVPEVSDALYQKQRDGLIVAESFYVTRLPQHVDFLYSRQDLYDEDLLNSYKSVTNLKFDSVKDDSGNTYCNVYHYPTAFDKTQLSEIKPYLVSGSIDHLTATDVIALYSDEDRLGSELCANIKAGQKLTTENADAYYDVAAVAVIPEDVFADLHFDCEKFPRAYVFSLDSLLESGHTLIEHYQITLRNTSTASSVQDAIDTALNESGSMDHYFVNNLALTVETNRFTTFIIEVLLYPLFGLLFIVSLLNINNVFVGNVHLKRNDISIMKSVGMTGAQLNMLFIFEYLEGYLNAAFLVIAIFVPLALLEGYLGIASSFDFGANIVGTLIISILVCGVVLVAPLIMMTLRRIRQILPIENLKDVD